MTQKAEGLVAAGAADEAGIPDQLSGTIEPKNRPKRAAVKLARPLMPPPPMAIAIWGPWKIFAVDEPIVKRGTAACSRCGAAHEISLAGDLPRCGCLATRGRR